MVAEAHHEHSSEWAAMQSVADKLGVGSTQTLANWVRRAQFDATQRPSGTQFPHEESRRGPPDRDIVTQLLVLGLEPLDLD